MATENQTKSFNVLFLWKAGIIVGSGGLIFGYDIGIIAGTLQSLSDHYNLTSYEEGFIVSILYLGSIVGSFIGGPLCDYLGRWKTIHIQNLIFITGDLWTALAPTVTHIYIGRFIVGIASAISGIADVPYLTEISPAQFRGLMSSQYEMLIGIGVFLSFCSALILARIDQGWRLAFLIPLSLAFSQSICLLFLPDSPKWLIQKHKFKEAYNSLSVIYGREYLSTVVTVDFDADVSSPLHSQQQSYSSNGITNTPRKNYPDDAMRNRKVKHKVKTMKHRYAPTQTSASSHGDETSNDSEDEVYGSIELGSQVVTPNSRISKSNKKNNGYAAITAGAVRSKSHNDGPVSDVPLSSLGVSQYKEEDKFGTPHYSDATQLVHEMPDDVALFILHYRRHQMDATSNSTEEKSQDGNRRNSAHNLRQNDHRPKSLNNVITNPLFEQDSTGNRCLRSASSESDREKYPESEELSEEQLAKVYMYPIIMVIVIQILAQMTGGNVIRNFAPTIFENGGISKHTALVFNVLLGLVKALFTFISIVFIENSGRKKLFMVGITTLTMGMGILTIGGLVSGGNLTDPVAFVAGCILIYAGFGLGYGPIPWVLSSEMFPTAIRGRVMSVSLLASNVAQLVANFIFLPIADGINNAGAFGLFLVLNIGTLAYVYCFVIETKEIEPPEILHLLHSRYDSWCGCVGSQKFFLNNARGIHDDAMDKSTVGLSGDEQKSEVGSEHNRSLPSSKPSEADGDTVEIALFNNGT